MAIVTPSFNDLSRQFFGNVVVVYTWAALANTDSGIPVSGPGWADRSFQVTGTFGAGGTVAVEGSNDAINYYTLNDPFGNFLNVTAPGVYELTQIALWMRPRVTGGDITTNLTITATLGRHGYP